MLEIGGENFFRKTEGYFTLRKKRKNFLKSNFCKKIAKKNKIFEKNSKKKNKNKIFVGKKNFFLYKKILTEASKKASVTNIFYGKNGVYGRYL